MPADTVRLHASFLSSSFFSLSSAFLYLTGSVPQCVGGDTFTLHCCRAFSFAEETLIALMPASARLLLVTRINKLIDLPVSGGSGAGGAALARASRGRCFQCVSRQQRGCGMPAMDDQH